MAHRVLSGFGALIALFALFALVAVPVPAAASLVTLVGSQFDLTYDDTQLGLYGTPALVGNSFSFTPGAFRAGPVSSGTSNGSSLLTGILLTAHGGYVLSGLSVVQSGNYAVALDGSSVTANAQITAYNTSNQGGTSSTVAFPSRSYAISGSSGSGSGPWSATAALAAGGGGVAAGLFNAAQLGFSMQSDLVATASGGLCVRGVCPSASIDINSVIGTVTVDTVATVPLPASWLLLLFGGGGLGFIGRRPKREVMIAS